MRRLVLKDPTIPFMRGTIDVGWRIKCSDGWHDMMWGNTKNDDSLQLLIADIELRQDPIDQIIDERKGHEI